MKKLFLLALFAPLLHAQVSVQGTAIQIGSKQGPAGATGCVVGETCTDALNPKSLGGVLYAELFPGSDIGAKINAAFEACGGTLSLPLQSCIVNLPPGKNYAFSTTIHIPNILSHGYVQSPQLQLNGSFLGYTGTTDAVIVHGENANAPASTGGIYNGVIAGTSNLTGLNIIHSLGRLGFVLDGLNILGGENCILLENTNTDGGPGYHEENTYTNFQTGSCPHHVNSIIGTGGTNSFEYNFFDNWHLQMAGQNVVEECGICALSGEDWQGLYMNAKVNTSSPVTVRVSLIRATGSFMARGTVVLHGENTGGATTTFGLYASGGGVIHYDGSASITGFTPFGDDGGNTTTAVLNNFTYHASESVFEFGFKARQCAYIYDYQSPKHWFAQLSGEQADCSEQWLTRVTTGADPKVNLPIAGGAVPTNDLFMQSSGKNGFGPGYGLVDDSTGSHRSPTHSLEATDFGVSSLSTGSTIVSSDFLAPNMPTGGDTCIDLGKLNTSTNSFLVCFRNTGTNSTDNRLFFTPIGSFTPVMIDALGNIYLPTIKSTTGARYVCVDTNGKLISQASACVGT